MKNIEVSEEMYKSLVELSKEMKSQDNRMTAMPHMFQIQTTEEVAAYEGNDGDVVWVSPDGNELRSDEEIKSFIVQYIEENDFFSNSIALEKFKEMDEIDIEIYLEKQEFRKIEVTTMHKYQNTFFTAKACDEHIKSNGHHYADPVCYLNHAFRNPEMELISTFLCGLTK